MAKNPPARPRCRGCNRMLDLVAHALPLSGDDDRKLGEWTPAPCRKCEGDKTMPLSMTPGRAWRNPKTMKTWEQSKEPEAGPMEVVEVSKAVAAGSRYMGEAYWDGAWRAALGFSEEGAQSCAVFWNSKTGEVFYQPKPAPEDA